LGELEIVVSVIFLSKQPMESAMPVLLLPVLIGLPVVIGGSYLIYTFVK